MLVGVFGEIADSKTRRNSPAGCLLPPPAMRAGEPLRAETREETRHTVMPIHRAVLTTKQDRTTFRKNFIRKSEGQRIIAQSMRESGCVLWATPCGRGCAIRANYQSTTVHLPPAMATGNLGPSFPMR